MKIQRIDYQHQDIYTLRDNDLQIVVKGKLAMVGPISVHDPKGTLYLIDSAVVEIQKDSK